MPIKKTPPKHQPTRSEHGQTAASRRSAEAHLRTLIDRFSPAHLRLITTIRRSLRKRLPTAHELVYEYRDAFVISFSPSEHGYQGVLAIRGTANGVTLYFGQGKDLPDPEKLLQGSGKQTRSIPIETASKLTHPAIARLIEEALARNPTPFPRTGRGPLIIRPTAAATRPPKKSPRAAPRGTTD